jgi:hypothetical protein
MRFSAIFLVLLFFGISSGQICKTVPTPRGTKKQGKLSLFYHLLQRTIVLSNKMAKIYKLRLKFMGFVIFLIGPYPLAGIA